MHPPGRVPLPSSIEHMSVNHGGKNIIVPQGLLRRPHVITVLQEDAQAAQRTVVEAKIVRGIILNGAIEKGVMMEKANEIHALLITRNARVSSSRDSRKPKGTPSMGQDGPRPISLPRIGLIHGSYSPVTAAVAIASSDCHSSLFSSLRLNPHQLINLVKIPIV